MSMTSKVDFQLRANILKSLGLFTGKTNQNLHNSLIANPNPKYSLRAIQEATQKLVKDGTLITSRFDKTRFYPNTPEKVLATAPEKVWIGRATV